jgi:hypothetical protein
MAMQRHTGCHLPPREAERPAGKEPKMDNTETRPDAPADSQTQPAERPND